MKQKRVYSKPENAGFFRGDEFFDAVWNSSREVIAT
jgi:hypothetical protein